MACDAGTLVDSAAGIIALSGHQIASIKTHLYCTLANNPPVSATERVTDGGDVRVTDGGDIRIVV